MKVDYAPRAIADLKRIGLQSRRAFGDAVAVALETYIRATVVRISVLPYGAQPLPNRPGVRVVPLVRYPFKIFYTAIEDRIVILHIRHSSRRSWEGE
jgi:plasmid stabilization system protein ParE